MVCASCGAPIPDGARFCPSCGGVVAGPLATDERKVVTVLFADLVDSTGLARRLDPERAREVLSRFFDAVSEELQSLRGRVEKFIGDAVMAVFGLPTVHEDDALRGVRAGLAIRARVSRLSDELGSDGPLEVRVGIETGEAAVGVGPAGQLLLTGPVVHTAVRLQSAADPGEVVVGDTTASLIEHAVTLGPSRRLRAKGFDDALAARPVIGVSGRTTRRTIPFVGRTGELAILRQSLARVIDSGRPTLISVIGEPGIGKSRLADELVAGLDEDVTVLVARSRSYADETTFGPAAAIVAELAGLDEADEPGDVRTKLETLVRSIHRGSGATLFAEQLGLLFDLSTPRDDATFVPDVLAGVLGLVDDLAASRPVVIVVDDAQGLRSPMLDLVERLGVRASDGHRRAMVMVLARSELLRDRPAWGRHASDSVMIRLDRLSPEDSIALVREAGGDVITDDAAIAIAERAGGNPFFIIETTGVLRCDAGGLALDGIGSLPHSVRALVSARLDGLSDRSRELARRASVFFVSFDREELRVIDVDVTDEELVQLVDAEIVVREGAERSPRFRLRHSTLKDVAYASLAKRERVRLHLRLADWLIGRGHASWAAEHLASAAQASLDLDANDRSVPDRAVDALVTAGDRARRRMESRSALDYYRRALSIAGHEDAWGTREARALAGMGESHYWVGEYPQASAVLDRAVTIGSAAHDDATLALALRFLGDIAINVEADLDRAEDLLERSLSAAERLGDPWSIVRTLLFAGWVPWTRDRYDESEAIWRRALDLADPDDGWARVRALNSLSINRTGGPDAVLDGSDPLAEALRLSDDANELAERIGDPFSIAVTTVQRARVLAELGRLEESIPCLDRAVEIFDELDATWEMGDALAERGIVHRELGRLDDAEDDLRSAIRISERIGERQLATWTWRALARVSEARGDDAEANERWQRSREADAAFAQSQRADS